MTISDALASVQNRSVSYREAEVFLGHILNVNRAYLHAHPEQRLTQEQRRQFASAIKRREKNEPVAYITGSKEFYGRRFHCDSRALIPRPETETAIEAALQFLPEHFRQTIARQNTPCPLHILELGTGCGNIAITLGLELSAANLPATILATDLSAEAINLAEENWQALGAGAHRHLRFNLITADLFDHAQIKKEAPFDLILANLPYVEDSWAHNPAAQADVIFHEPELALFGGADGLDIYRRFFAKAPNYLATTGACIVEHGEAHGTAILALAKQAWPTAQIETRPDYAGLDRITMITLPS